MPGRQLHRLLGATPARRSFPSGLPLLPLDRIWISPGRLLHAIDTLRTPLSRVASDHLPLVAEIDLTAATSTEVR